MKTFICSVRYRTKQATQFVNSLHTLPHKQSGLLFSKPCLESSIIHNIRNWNSPWLKITLSEGTISDVVQTSHLFARRTTHTLPQLIRLFNDPAFLTKHKLIQ